MNDNCAPRGRRRPPFIVYLAIVSLLGLIFVLWKTSPKRRSSTDSEELSQSLDGAPRSLGPVDELIEKHLRMQRKAILEAGRPGAKKYRAIKAKCKRGIGQGCCGLGDRLYGLIILFLGAAATDRLFFIDHDKPLPLENYLEPNRLEWRMRSLSDEARKTLDKCDGCPYAKTLDPAYCDQITKAIHWKDDVIEMLSNHRTDCLLFLLTEEKLLPKGSKNWSQQERQLFAGKVANRIFHHLFKFSALVESTTEKLLATSLAGRGYVTPRMRDCMLCVHVRSGAGLKEDSRTMHKNPDQFIECALWAQTQMLAQGTCPNLGHPVWLVISDDDGMPGALKDRAKSQANVTVVSTTEVGPLIHVDMEPIDDVERAKKGFLRVFVDFRLLVGCQYFVASLSTFSGVASLVHGEGVKRFDMEMWTTCKAEPKGIGDWPRDRNRN